MLAFSFEHESNGKDGVESRSWNYFSLSGVYFFNPNISVQSKFWAGWYGKENKDLKKYRGHWLMSFNYKSLNDKFMVSVFINPCKKIGNYNTQLEFNYQLNPVINQYLFIQWYNGYGEGLFNYDKYMSMLRIGISIKPPMWNFY